MTQNFDSLKNTLEKEAAILEVTGKYGSKKYIVC